MARSSPLFIVIASVIFLNESITTWGILDIVLILIGAYMLHLRSFSFDDFSFTMKSLGDPSSFFALTAAIGTTIYSVVDKLGVTTIDPILYSFWLGFFVTGMLSIVVIHRRGLNIFQKIGKPTLIRASVAGVLMKGGYILVLLALSFAQLSYIIPLRQVSVVLGTLLGVLLLKERYGRIRIISSIVIFLGVYLLGVFA